MHAQENQDDQQRQHVERDIAAHQPSPPFASGGCLLVDQAALPVEDDHHQIGDRPERGHRQHQPAHRPGGHAQGPLALIFADAPGIEKGRPGAQDDADEKRDAQKRGKRAQQTPDRGQHRVCNNRGAQHRARIDGERQLQEGDCDDRVLDDLLGAGDRTRQQAAAGDVQKDQDREPKRPEGRDQMDRSRQPDGSSQRPTSLTSQLLQRFSLNRR